MSMQQTALDLVRGRTVNLNGTSLRLQPDMETLDVQAAGHTLEVRYYSVPVGHHRACGIACRGGLALEPKQIDVLDRLMQRVIDLRRVVELWNLN